MISRNSSIVHLSVKDHNEDDEVVIDKMPLLNQSAGIPKESFDVSF